MRSIKSVAVAGICTLLLSACFAPAELEAGAVAADKAKLDDTVFAFYLSPQSYTWNAGLGSRNPAYVVLVRPDGSYRTIRTRGMDIGQLAWSAEGLYFGDDERDYLLHDDGLTTFRNPKPDMQQSAFAVPDGFVAIYNEGVGGPGHYSNQVAATTRQATKLYPVEGNYFMNASCDGVVYGIATDPGAHRVEAADRPDLRSKTDPTIEPEMLARLYPAGADGREEVLGWRAAFNGGTGIQHAPCAQGVISYLSAYDDVDGQPRTVVVSWDTATGAYVEHPLVDEGGRSIPREDLEFVRYDSGSLRDGELEWFASDGRIVATDTATGVTTRRFDTGYRSTASQFAQVVFTDTSIHVLYDVNDRRTPLAYGEFDRATGATVRSLTIDGISKHLSTHLVMRGMAVRPRA
ncbi:hypothetical protein AB0C02_30605 [Micromonospora sp. NPDC048999]|uniref:hypothetical protein n=1 Tax=Micromonospora sp. NPDC048999 TaxID=3155391 RepID=UPI0033F12ED7